MLDILIFSKNRPLQLQGLIKSLLHYSNVDSKKINVLYKYDDQYLEGINNLKYIHQEINFIKETDFNKQVKEFLGNGEKFCSFFVDDIIVKDNFDFTIPCKILELNPHIMTFSLRLGTHLTFCYALNSSQLVPNGVINSGIFIWNWKNSQHDWNYPLSLDGHIFRKSDIESWSSHLSFKNPNQYESQLQSVRSNFVMPDICCSFLKSKIFNLPLNRVQNEFQNRCEDISIDDLYELWKSKKEIDYLKFENFMNKSVHEPLSLPLVSRK